MLERVASLIAFIQLSHCVLAVEPADAEAFGIQQTVIYGSERFSPVLLAPQPSEVETIPTVIGLNEATRLSELEDEISRLKESIKEMEKDVKRNKERRHDLQGRMDEAEGDIKRNKGRRHELQDRMDEAESDIDRNKERRHDLQNRVDKIEHHRVGGSFQFDWANFDQDEQNIATIGNMQNGVEIRRARVRLTGELTQLIDYELEFSLTGDEDEQDVGAGEVHFLDVYAEFKEVAPLSRVRVGHFREPFSLERQGGLTFMEFSLANAFVPGRNLGIMTTCQPSENATISTGLFCADFSSELGQSIGDDSGLSASTRFTWLPVYDELSGGRALIHLGLAHHYHDEKDNEVRFRQRPESNLADFFASTGRFASEGYHLLGLEAAMVYGRLSLQSEYIRAMVDQINNPSVSFEGYYVYASCFLTGENRRYSRRRGAFRRSPNIFEEFFRVRTGGGIAHGCGAWELGIRYSHLDLNDKNIDDEKLDNVTLGLNWYLNDRMRMMWNYVHAHLTDNNDPESNAGIYQMRFQVSL